MLANKFIGGTGRPGISPFGPDGHRKFTAYSSGAVACECGDRLGSRVMFAAHQDRLLTQHLPAESEVAS